MFTYIGPRLLWLSTPASLVLSALGIGAAAAALVAVAMVVVFWDHLRSQGNNATASKRKSQEASDGRPNENLQEDFCVGLESIPSSKSNLNSKIGSQPDKSNDQDCR